MMMIRLLFVRQHSSSFSRSHPYIVLYHPFSTSFTKTMHPGFLRLPVFPLLAASRILGLQYHLTHIPRHRNSYYHTKHLDYNDAFLCFSTVYPSGAKTSSCPCSYPFFRGFHVWRHLSATTAAASPLAQQSLSAGVVQWQGYWDRK